MEKVSKRLVSWASMVESNTLEQAERSASMPFVFPHVALMPDAHLGKGATVGSVIPTDRAIIPAAVGVDIGCGMIAVRTQHTRSELPPRATYPVLRTAIEDLVPLSAGSYNTGIWGDGTQTRLDELEALADKAGFDPASYAGNWRLQLGTLGSGNHFIEVSVDEADRVWLFLHSGSRGIGNKIAQRHIAVARDLCARWYIDLPDSDLAYLVQGTPEFDRYIAELHWAQRFAFLNREEMMDRVVHAFDAWLAASGNGAVEPVIREETVNCHHNFTQREKHWGRSVWVSRKGAIEAREGQPGLIPGSMGTASYVVRGRGNAVSLNSSPHGAGRRYSRSAARRTFTHDDLRAAMGDIEYRDTDAFVDEIPSAYKPIDVVMKDAADLVEVVHTLRQLVNVKGD